MIIHNCMMWEDEDEFEDYLWSLRRNSEKDSVHSLNDKPCEDKMLLDKSNSKSSQGFYCKSCGHNLSFHIDDGDYLRCHGLYYDENIKDSCQCECRIPISSPSQFYCKSCNDSCQCECRIPISSPSQFYCKSCNKTFNSDEEHENYLNIDED